MLRSLTETEASSKLNECNATALACQCSVPHMSLKLNLGHSLAGAFTWAM
jgi:hypothetical protein